MPLITGRWGRGAAGTWVFLRFSPGVVEVEVVPIDGGHFLPWPQGVRMEKSAAHLHYCTPT